MTSSPRSVAVVTGASSGVGRAIFDAFLRAGYDVALLGRNTTRLREMTNQTSASGQRVHCYTTDLLHDDQILRAASAVQRDFGAVDLLVHAAGLMVRAPIAGANAADFDTQYRVNVRAPFVLTQAFLPELFARKGQVVFINSTATFAASPLVTQYAATKHALKGFADGLRAEVNDSGIRVLSVFLGRTATPMQQAIHEAEGARYTPERLVQPADVAATVLALVGLPRTVEATEVTLRPMLKPLGGRA